MVKLSTISKEKNTSIRNKLSSRCNKLLFREEVAKRYTGQTPIAEV